jgi:hypothetical protein
MKEITITIDLEGTTTTNLKGFELESPKIAADFEKVLGKVAAVKWSPKAHGHVHTGAGGHRH